MTARFDASIPPAVPVRVAPVKAPPVRHGLLQAFGFVVLCIGLCICLPGVLIWPLLGLGIPVAGLGALIMIAAK